MYDRVLVPTDGSTGTAHVAMQAFDLAEQYGASVHLLHVIDSNVGRMFADSAESRAEMRDSGRRAIGTLEELASGYEIETVSELREGEPWKEILACADDIDADVIVMGTNGRSGIERRLIGSVTERVVRHSDHPVLTVRLPETGETVADDEEAAAIVSERLEADGYGTVDVEGTSRHRNVWVVDVTADGSPYTVYVDPVTRRTSAVHRTESEL